MIRIKQGVRFVNLKPHIYGMFGFLEFLWNSYGVDPVITSANDSKHMSGSKHYTDDAIDLRSKNLPDDEAKKAILEKLKHHLGSDYDVLLEGIGTVNEHYHVEFDPR